MHRGSLIVLEGMQLSGVSSVAKRLANDFKNVVVLEFPNNAGPFSNLTSGYSSGWLNINPSAGHYLMSADIWNRVPEIIGLLKHGNTVVCDRYCYSEMVKTMVLGGIKWSWCRLSECGLPKPDLVIFLEATPITIKSRQSISTANHYEHYLEQVYQKFHHVKWLEANWIEINTNIMTLDEVYRRVFDLVWDEVSSTRNALSFI